MSCRCYSYWSNACLAGALLLSAGAIKTVQFLSMAAFKRVMHAAWAAPLKTSCGCFFSLQSVLDQQVTASPHMLPQAGN